MKPGRQALRKLFRHARPGVVLYHRAKGWGIFVARTESEGGVGLVPLRRRPGRTSAITGMSTSSREHVRAEVAGRAGHPTILAEQSTVEASGSAGQRADSGRADLPMSHPNGRSTKRAREALIEDDVRRVPIGSCPVDAQSSRR